jgi:hypothetical protein
MQVSCWGEPWIAAIAYHSQPWQLTVLTIAFEVLEPQNLPFACVALRLFSVPNCDHMGWVPNHRELHLEVFRWQNATITCVQAGLVRLQVIPEGPRCCTNDY